MALNEALRARQQKPDATERAPRPPADMRPEEWQTRVDLAAAYRLAAIYGWTDLKWVIHTHSRFGTAVATQRQGLLPVSQKALTLMGWIAYHDFEGPATD